MMIYFSSIVNYCLENKRNMFVFLLFFHVFISVILFNVANTEYLSSLHNGYGLWNFAQDSNKYHDEALNLIPYLEKSAWSDWWHLYPDHHHVKVISLIYWITGIHSPISFEIVNSVVWVTSFILIFKTSELLFPGDYKVSLITSIFFFQPSVLISSMQLLKEPIYILGFCLMFYGLTIFSKQNSRWKWVFITQIGVILMLLMRSYLSTIFLIFLALFAVIVFFKKKTFVVPLLVFLIPIFMLDYVFDPMSKHMGGVLDKESRLKTQEKLEYHSGQEKLYKIQRDFKLANDAYNVVLDDNALNVEPVVDETPLVVDEVPLNVALKEKIFSPITSYMWVFDGIAIKLQLMRNGFYLVNFYSGSSIDIDKKYNNFSDLIIDIPRVLQIGFLAPFPSNWFQKGFVVGTIGHLLAGLEMIIWYFVLLGFIYITYKNPSVIKPFLVVFLLSISLIVLLSYVIPNVGALYRMRQAYMIPFYLFGAHGLSLMISNFTKKQYK